VAWLIVPIFGQASVQPIGFYPMSLSKKQLKITITSKNKNNPGHWIEAVEQTF
jgi:hypothetical protein